MPRVGDKHYPYTAKGQAAAKAAAKRKGVKVSHGKGYNKGGSVSKSRVNLGAGAPKRKKRAAKKMQGGGPAINPNIPNAPTGMALQRNIAQAQMGPGPGKMRPGGPGPGANIPQPIMGPGGGRQPPIVKPRPPGVKKGGGVKKNVGGLMKKKLGKTKTVRRGERGPGTGSSARPGARKAPKFPRTQPSRSVGYKKGGSAKKK